MRQTFLLLATSSFLVCTANLAKAQKEIPMQVCTPISTGDCATPFHWLTQPTMKFSKGAQAGALVVLNLVVGSDGSVHDIEIVKSPDEELTKEVISSAKKWKFSPATFQGQPVAVAVRLLVQFRSIGDPMIRFQAKLGTWTDAAEIQKLDIEASQALDRGDYQQAVALSRQLLALEPLHERIRLVLGVALADLQQYKDAETALQEEIKLDPKNPFAYNSLGWVYWREYKYDDAIAQFRKQIEITPESFNPHANLGVLLCSRKRCGEAMPELQKALALSPEQARLLLAEGKCDIDLGNTTKGISEMAQAANKAASSSSWDQAAYRLAERNVELDTARKWAERAITIDSAYLQDLSLDHVTPTQMNKVNSLASYWDTLGWVYFQMGDDDRALNYVDAAWRMHPTPTMGDHLGQIYEKLGQREDSLRTYAMAVASADLSKQGVSSPEDLADARNRLARLLGQGANIPALIEQGRADIEAIRSITIENPTKLVGNADFLIKVVGDKTTEVRQITGDASLASFSEVLLKTPLAMHIPEESEAEILRRGTLSCNKNASECHFMLLGTEEAAKIATQEANAAKAKMAN